MVCLDTGADRCVFPLSLVESLGLDVTRMPRDQMFGATGRGGIYYADVHVSVPFRIGQRRYALSVDTRAGFVAGLDAQGIGLLGQVGFFDRYAVSFDQPRGHFTIHDLDLAALEIAD